MASESVDEDNLKISNAGSNGQFLSKQSGNTGGLTWATIDLSAATDYDDNVKIRFGTDNDLEIFHDGSNSRVRETGTGNLRLEGTAVELWNDGSKVCNTFANGIQVTGISSTGGIDVAADDAKIRLGASQDLQIYHDPDINVIDAASGNLEIRHGNEKMIACANDGK